jgi:hypothetical protein
VASNDYRKITHDDFPLAPGQAVWVDLGASDNFGNCALSVTASPYTNEIGTHVLKVDNVNITQIESVNGDIAETAYLAGCNVTNNGQTTIDKWTVQVGLIGP